MRVYKFTMEPTVFRCKLGVQEGFDVYYTVLYDAIKDIQLNEKNEIVLNTPDGYFYICKQKNPEEVIAELNKRRQTSRRPTIY
jgi:hypothetical protein